LTSRVDDFSGDFAVFVNGLDDNVEVSLARISFFWSSQARGRYLSLVLELGANVLCDLENGL
jgi:hypothetical protein